MKPSRLLIIASLVACAADPRSADPRDPGAPASHTQTMSGLTLTAGAPRQGVAIAAPAAATTVLVTIAAIDNPSRQPFSVAVSLWTSSPDAAASEEPLGTVTPYPSTRPGTFTIGIPDAARKWLARGDGQLSLQVTLVPVDPARPLVEPLKVTLGDATWR